MIIGRFSNVILNNPRPKFKKLLQKTPITTLMAHSIAAALITLALLKKLKFFLLRIKNLLSAQHMAEKERKSLLPYEAGCKTLTATQRAFVPQATPRPAGTSRQSLYSS
jgi:hypothetical protein